MIAATHPAVREGRTLFPAMRRSVAQAGRLLIPGDNRTKLGRRVHKGAWRGMPIHSLTLEERATCPADCAVWAACYGNGSHWSKRVDHLDPAFAPTLRREIASLAAKHPGGYVVRLHQLGDFFSTGYVTLWRRALERHPALRLFGYTARRPDSPIGRRVADDLNLMFPGRCLIRFSGQPGPLGAVTIWRHTDERVVPEGIVCPHQRGVVPTCGACALCWAPAAADKTIVFIGHGR